MVIKFLIAFAFVISTVASVWSQDQNQKNQLAYQYYRDKEYQRAVELYQELYQDTRSESYLQFAIKCYVELKAFDKAEKMVKQALSGRSSSPNLQVLLGKIYAQAGEFDKSKKTFDKLVNQMGGTTSDAVLLANAFIAQQEYDYAEKVYLKAQKQAGSSYSFAFDLANLYSYARNYPKMIDAFLDALQQDESQLQNVQNRLQYTVYQQDDGSLNNLLKEKLIARIQASKSQTAYSELLIWIYLQDKDFAKALLQAKAIDKRQKEKGERLIPLGELATLNGDYGTAVKCYEYVISLGETEPFFVSAQTGYMQSLYAELTHTDIPQPDKVQTLVSQYQKFASDHPNQDSYHQILPEYAHVLAFYAQSAKEANGLLVYALDNARLSAVQESKIKLELADILLFQDNIWESNLFYSQVIKANPNNDLGNEAQLKKAKLSFYSGDFLWAKGQMDVLRAATSKLIANDAFYWASLIDDNLGDDSLLEPLQVFARADLRQYQFKYKEALTSYDSVLTLFPGHGLTDDALYRKAILSIKLGENADAKMYLQKILDEHYTDLLADNAMMSLAELYASEGQEEKAVELYTQLLVDFSDSFYTTEARRRIVKFRDS